MKEFCENEYCDNPGAKVVPVSEHTPGDSERTLCAACEEAYSTGVQHGFMVARGNPDASWADLWTKASRKRSRRGP